MKKSLIGLASLQVAAAMAAASTANMNAIAISPGEAPQRPKLDENDDALSLKPPQAGNDERFKPQGDESLIKPIITIEMKAGTQPMLKTGQLVDKRPKAGYIKKIGGRSDQKLVSLAEEEHVTNDDVRPIHIEADRKPRIIQADRKPRIIQADRKPRIIQADKQWSDVGGGCSDILKPSAEVAAKQHAVVAHAVTLA